MAEFEDSDFKDQIIALTVPASFDDVARELTVEASEKAVREYIEKLNRRKLK